MTARRIRVRPAALAGIAGLLAFAAALTATGDPPTQTVGGVPLFGTWPTDNKPDAVIVLSGQTFGHLKPCGCSVDQKGGLERRYNLIAALKNKGWALTALDLGDLAAQKDKDAPYKSVHEQNLLKYRTAMRAMTAMGYSAVGLGETEFRGQLFELLTADQAKGDAPPHVLAANLVSVDENGVVSPREKAFPPITGTRPAVGGAEAIPVGTLPVGVVSVIGPSVLQKLATIDKSLAGTDNGETLKAMSAALKASKWNPDFKVLLYQGTKDEAVKAAAAFPEYQLIVCLIDESEPPQFPTLVNGNKTTIVQVGHKGQNVGVVGVFRKANGYELHYQLVPLTKDFDTAPAAKAAHPVLKIMQDYADEVKKRDLLAQFTARPQPHEAQVQYPAENLVFVGSEACLTCHAAEAKVWQASLHSHALDALIHKATDPKLRQFDGDCVRCHVVGFGKVSGFVSEAKTPNLKHVGCESCHGPGSGHAAAPNDKAKYASLSSWKTTPAHVLPGKDVLAQLAAVKPGEPNPVPLTPAQQQTITAVSALCMSCHDPDNDPKFDLNVYMPKIWHAGLKKAGLPANAK